MLQLFRILLVLVLFGLTSCNWLDNDDIETTSQLGVAPLESGLQEMGSGGELREFFMQIPAGAGTASTGEGMSQVAAVGDGTSQVASHTDGPVLPLIFLLHGYTGSYLNWVGDDRAYDMVDVVGDEAFIVVPQALPDAAGLPIWGGEADLDFFIDMLALFDRRGVPYDHNRVFVMGHSNGGGFTHQLGCVYGDVFRAIVTAAGSLFRTDCVGSIAAMMFHGENDPIGSAAPSEATREYLVKYNGWDTDAFVPAFDGRCDDHSFPDKPDNLPYPVVYCLHQQGHDIPDFGGEIAWDFLTSLPEVEPTPDAPPGGGAEVATPPADTTLTFQVDVPVEMPRPLAIATTLRPLSFLENETCSRPDVILTDKITVEGELIPGQLSEPITVPITYLFLPPVEEQFPSDWALSITFFVEGGSTASIPTPFVDYAVRIPLSLVSRTAPVVISEVLTPEPGGDPCGLLD